jgi:hypothetical protein
MEWLNWRALNGKIAIVFLALALSACELTSPPTVIPPIPPSATPPPLIPSQTPAPDFKTSVAHFQVFILNPVHTCIAGNDFYSGDVCYGTNCGDCNCTWSEFDPLAPLTGIPPERINDPQYAGYAQRVCFDVSLSDSEVADIINDMEATRDLVDEWTGGALKLDLDIRVIPHTHTGFVAPDFVFGPFEVDDELLNPYVSTETDFVYVVTGQEDPVQGKHLSGWCGGSYGEMSIHGAGYAYIQYNDMCNSVTINGHQIYEPLIHEWIHGLDWALYNIDGVSDPYQFRSPDWSTWNHASWPGCNEGATDPLAWFPSIDFCEWDPDWRDCNNTQSAGRCIHAGETYGKPSWYEHVIAVHYPRNIVFNGNFCQDGRQDFGETGVDQDGACP